MRFKMGEGTFDLFDLFVSYKVARNTFEVETGYERCNDKSLEIFPHNSKQGYYCNTQDSQLRSSAILRS